MLDDLKDRLKSFFSSRPNVLALTMVIFTLVILGRLFVLQIIKGDYYIENYNLRIAKSEYVQATRGEIYDRNGILLAYNELAYAVTIKDSGTYKNYTEKNAMINDELYQVITNLEKCGDSIDNEFKVHLNSAGKYEFTVSGTSLQRFRADIFGKNRIQELGYNDKLGLDESTATADQIMSYLCDKRFEIPTEYSTSMRYKIAIVRYNMALNSYQKYIATVIASNVNEKTVAYIEENKNDLTGVDVEERAIRKYVDGEYFAGIIGYTGTISTDEYNEKSVLDETVEPTDTIGKAGIEQYMDEYLSGVKGSQTLYVDSIGNPLEVTDQVEPVPGQNVYLSIDYDLQVDTYKLLEKQLAGILYSKILNVKEYHATSDADIMIPIYDVYYALVKNNLIDIYSLNDDDSTDVEKNVYRQYENKKESVISTLRSQLQSSVPTVYNELSPEYQEYSTYIVKKLRADEVIESANIDETDELYQKWINEELSVNEFLRHAIEMDWVDITAFTARSQYVDTDELYDQLIDYILENAPQESDFTKLLYKYAILNDEIRGEDLCAILYDQGVLEEDEVTRNALVSGGTTGYAFIRNKINTLEITPGELALDPCSASCVILDAKNGDVLACVSYPGYDNNKLANPTSSAYFNYLNSSESTPLYNHATQQRTAPGSTFKLLSSVTGLAEGTITTSSEIEDLGVFDKVSNHPKCWLYTSSHATHGSINVSEAIRDSCNYFFYELGWELAGGDFYNDEAGIEKIKKYAALYGLDSKTGVEIEEAESQVATEYPVMAAIGQSDNNYTTIALARYVTAIANGGTVYNLSLLDHVEDKNGNLVMSYGPTVKNQVDCITYADLSAIHHGMRMVVENSSTWKDFPIEVAGKTGTAQQDLTRANHALFVGYAPYNNPEIALCTRIPFGYTSSNAAEASKHIIGAYFKDEESLNILEAETATDIDNASSNAIID